MWHIRGARTMGITWIPQWDPHPALRTFLEAARYRACAPRLSQGERDLIFCMSAGPTFERMFLFSFVASPDSPNGNGTLVSYSWVKRSRWALCLKSPSFCERSIGLGSTIVL